MRNRASLVLMEQLVMLLVFALAAAMCLQLFVKADGRSGQTQRYSESVILAQNGAEALKTCGGDLQQAAVLLGGQADANALSVQQDGLVLKIIPEPTHVVGLGQARVSVLEASTGNALFSLQVGWQEVIP